MNAPIRPDETDAQVVPMTVEALRILDEQGFFANDNHRHELIEGVLIMVPPPGTLHQNSEGKGTMGLARALVKAGLDRKYRVQTGGGFIIGEFSHLGPDLMVLREPDGPKTWVTSDVILMIEVSSSSIRKDLGTKARLYASAAIAEYWVLDVANKALIIHTEPTESRYGNIRTLRAPDNATSVLEPALSVPVADLF
jgi:Uma2 family endonuclease